MHVLVWCVPHPTACASVFVSVTAQSCCANSTGCSRSCRDRGANATSPRSVLLQHDPGTIATQTGKPRVTTTGKLRLFTKQKNLTGRCICFVLSSSCFLLSFFSVPIFFLAAIKRAIKTFNARRRRHTAELRAVITARGSRYFFSACGMAHGEAHGCGVWILFFLNYLF